MKLKFNKENINKGSILISVYLTCFLLFFLFKDFDFSLKDSSNFFISQATKEGIDISKRVSFFYKIIFSFFISVPFFYFLISKIKSIFKQNEQNLYSSFVLSFIGISIFISSLLGIKNDKMIELNLYLFLLSYFLSFYQKGINRLGYLSKLLPIIFIFGIIVHSGFLLLVNSNSLFLKNSLGYYFIFCCLILGSFIFVKKRTKYSIKALINLLIPIAFLPIFIFISIESEFFFKLKYNIFIPYKYVFLGLSVAGLFTYNLTFNRNKKLISAKKSLNKFFLPSALLCIILLTSYHPFIEEPTEMFEAANPSNALLRMFQFQEIPFVDFLSSHMFSEQFYGVLHSWIFGFDNQMSFMTYGFLYEVFFIFLAFALLKRIFKNGVLAFSFILFFPYFSILIHTGLFFSILGFFQAVKLLKKQSILNYFGLIAIVILLFFWRLDTGAATLMALFFFTPILFYIDSIKIEFNKSIKGFLLFGLLTILSIGGVLIFRSYSHLISNFKSALHYTSANQAHGYPTIITELNQQFVIYHVFFPLIAVLLILFIVYTLKKFKQDQLNEYILKASLFLFLIYLANFQRGLVRHNFMEGNESFLVATFYFALALFITSLFKVQNSIWRFMILFSVSFCVIVGLKYFPLDMNFKSRSELYLSENSLKNLDHYFNEENFKGKVIKNENFRNEKINDIKNFLDEELKPNESFFDFSNSPMLYYYTNRKVPFYFCQNLQNTIDDYLQLEHLKSLNPTEFPIIIYSNYPKSWYDETDGVSNSMRHYLLAEYIYKNYRPIGILNQHSIWLSKSRKWKTEKIVKQDTLITKLQINPYQRAAYYMNQYFKNQNISIRKVAKLASIKSDSSYTYFKIPKNILQNNGYFLKSITNNNLQAHEYKIDILDSKNKLLGSNTFYSTPEENEYMTRWSNHYLLHCFHSNIIRVSKFDKDKIIKLEFYLDER